MSVAKRAPPMAPNLHNSGKNIPRQRPRTRKRSEGNDNSHDSLRASPSVTSTGSHPRPNNNMRHGTDLSRELKAHIESNKIHIIPVAATLPTGRPLPTCIPLGNGGTSPANSAHPVPPGTAGQAPSSCLELARARAFHDGVLPVHRFIQFNQVFLGSRPHLSTVGNLSAGTLSGRHSIEAIESIYANIGQPAPRRIRERLGQEGLPERKPVEGSVRKSQDVTEGPQRLQAEG